jgi:RNA polymerase sigma factor (sigma-70 family)
MEMLRRNSSTAESECRWAMLAERDHAIDERVCASDQAVRVRLALSSLRADRREAIVLAYFGGMSYRQVAIELDVPEGTIKTRNREGLRGVSITRCSTV